MGANILVPTAVAYAEPRRVWEAQHPEWRLAQNTEIPAKVAGVELGDGETQTAQVTPNGATVTKVGTARRPLKIKPSADAGCGPGGDCTVTVKPLNLSRVPTEKELRMAGQMGGALSPLFPADVPVWQKKFDTQLKEAGVEGGLNAQVAPNSVPGKLVFAKRQEIERLKKMNLDFGKAMQDWNKHNYRVAAKQFETYLEKFPDSPWAGEAALHLGCDAKYNGRFNEAQTRFEEILQNTSPEPKDWSWEIHQKAKLRWADLDIALGRFNGAGSKLANLLQTEKDWRRKTWERHWYRTASASQKNAQVLRACGSRAVGQVFVSLGKKKEADALARVTPVKEAGFSLKEMADLAGQHGLAMQGFRVALDNGGQPQIDIRSLAAMPMPFIIHYDFGDARQIARVKQRSGSYWRPLKGVQSNFLKSTHLNQLGSPRQTALRRKLDAHFKPAEQAGHFLVVNSVDTASGKVHLLDPQEGRRYVLTVGQLQREWSGAGLMVASAGAKTRVGMVARPRLAKLTRQEMDRFVGGCCGEARPGGPHGPSGDENPCGSPVWSVSPVTLNLNFYDVPLWYNTPKGPDVGLSMSYNSLDSLTQNNAFGNKWMFGYGSYLVVDTTVGGGNVIVFMPDGQQHTYIPQGNNGFRSAQADIFNSLTQLSPTRFELKLLNGTKYIYGIPTGTNSMQPFLVEMQDKFGYSLTFGYDTDINLRTITDAQGKVTNLYYDSTGHIVRARTPFGQEATFDYDKNGNLIQVVDMEGNAFGYTYDADIRLTEMVTAQGSWKFTHQGPDGHGTEAFKYPEPTGFTDANMRIDIENPLHQHEEYYYTGGFYSFPGTQYPEYWHVSSRFYQKWESETKNNANLAVPKTIWAAPAGSDTIGRVAAIAPPSLDGGQTYQVTWTSYDPITHLPVAVTDFRGRAARMTYNNRGRVTSITDWKGRSAHLYYAANGTDFERAVDIYGRTLATAEYYPGIDGAPGLLKSAKGMELPSKTTTQATITYTNWGAAETVTDNLGTSGFSYNTDGRLESIWRDGVLKSQIEYDALGRTHKTTDLNGPGSADDQWAEYKYDELNNLRAVRYQDNSTVEMDSVCCGIPGVVKDRSGRRTYFDYDPLKRLVRVQDSAGYTSQVEYDDDGNVVLLLDAKGNETRFVYDEWGRTTAKSYPDNSRSHVAYDVVGRVSAQRTPGGKIIRYQYDDDDRVAKIDYPTLPDVTFDYDSRDRPVAVTDGLGTTRVTYNSSEQIASIDGPWQNDTITYGYDALSRPSWRRVNGGDENSYSYDSKSRLEALVSPAGTFGYVYNDDHDRLQELHLPNGSKMVPTYDPLGRLMQIQNLKGTGSTISSYSYIHEGITNGENYAGRGFRTLIEAQVGTDPLRQSAFGYNASNELTSEAVVQAITGGTESVYTNSFAYDNTGNRTAVTNQRPNGAGTGNITTSVSYDSNALNQLTNYLTTSTGASNVQSQLDYDGEGNLVQHATFTPAVGTTPAQPLGNTTYQYDDLERLTDVITRDAAGQFEHKTHYVYDTGSRRRVRQEFDWTNGAWSQTDERRYLYDGMLCIQERDGNNQVIASYTRTGITGGLLAKTVGDDSYYYHYDGGGNVCQMTDETQNVVASYKYDAYGNTLSATGPQASSNLYRYSTKEWQPHIGLYDFGLRFYNPGLGRWINRDPLREAGGLNLYSYVDNDPVNFLDPTGLSKRGQGAAGIAGAVLGAAIGGAVGGPAGAIAGALIGAAIGEGWISSEDGCGFWKGANEGVQGPGMDVAVTEVAMMGVGIGAAAAGRGLVKGGKWVARTGIIRPLAEEVTGGAPAWYGMVGCFVAGTPVLMADGSSKPIEQVKSGDMVMSRDEKTGKTAAKEVQSPATRQVSATRLVKFEGGQIVETTDEHPFYVEGKGFIPAKELGVGTSIVTRAGPSLKIASNETKKQSATVYNFTVRDFHSYFVGKNPIWVHNTSAVVKIDRLYHYSTESGVNGIVNSEEMYPSVYMNNPKDARYGDGQYFTDIVPGTKTLSELSHAFLRMPFSGSKFTHFVEIDVSGLTVVKGREGVFVVLNNTNLNVSGRILSHGPVPLPK